MYSLTPLSFRWTVPLVAVYCQLELSVFMTVVSVPVSCLNHVLDPFEISMAKFTRPWKLKCLCSRSRLRSCSCLCSRSSSSSSSSYSSCKCKCKCKCQCKCQRQCRCQSLSVSLTVSTQVFMSRVKGESCFEFFFFNGKLSTANFPWCQPLTLKC